MKILKLFVDEQGDSDFAEESIDFGDKNGDGILSSPFDIQNFTIVSLPGNSFQDWHPAPRKQFIFHFNGEVELTSSKGEKRIVRGGDLVLIEDVSGKGHQTKVLSNERVQIGLLPL